MNNRDMVSQLMLNGALYSPNLIKAFLAMDRKHFVAPQHVQNAYQDAAQALFLGATISQPSTVAFMLELLAPKTGNKILDIGAGSGWTTALLAECVGKQGQVIGLEIIPKLVEFAQANLKKFDYRQASIRLARSSDTGLIEEAPFDRILVSAAAQRLPYGLISQLYTGGRLVIPVQNSIFAVTKGADTQIELYEYPGFVFVPLKSV